ncbi:MAG: glycine cleavage system protein H [Actinomycetota bacterium]|nr:glycine cleavage system protein H [Actinomycetota bacterium]
MADEIDLNPHGQLVYDKGIVRIAAEGGCYLPEDLYYWIERHVWMRDEGDGTITIGLTDPAQNLSGILAKATIKPVGTLVKRGKPVAIMESGKWVGPLPAPLDGELVAKNDDAQDYPGVTAINKDPYGAGWIARLKVDDFERARAEFKTGKEGTGAYRKLIEEENIKCGK